MFSPLEFDETRQKYLIEISKAVFPEYTHVETVSRIGTITLYKGYDAESGHAEEKITYHWVEFVVFIVPRRLFINSMAAASVQTLLLVEMYYKSQRHPIDVLYDETSSLRYGTEKLD